MPAQITVTKTGLTKGYFDAVKSFREFLKISGILDFDNLEIEKKYLVPVKLLPSGLEIELSMYRPKTKNGAFKRVCLSKELSRGLELSAEDTIKFEMQGSRLSVCKLISSEETSTLICDINQNSEDKVPDNSDHGEQKSSDPDREIPSFESFQSIMEVEDGTPQENDFLLKLRRLQQDREDSISTPSSWEKPPLLEVPAKLDEKIDELQETTTKGTGNEGEWFFLVGSPGNGKSAYCGRYFRGLQGTHDFKFKREGEKGLLDLKNLKEDELPYRIEVHKKGESFARCWIIQDASVLQSTYDKVAEPADDLLQSLKEAQERGISLFVCTNRGVLETAFNRSLTEKSKHPEPEWEVVRKVIKNVAEGKDIPIEVGTKNSKAPFKKVMAKQEALDADSLLIGHETFAKLIDEATAEKEWRKCKACSFADKCPWSQNRDTLAAAEGKEVLLKILARAEALGGQVIVFRAALALLSYLLTGCASDQGKLSPCKWVERMIGEKNYFGLLSMRLYMQLFCSHSPLGLEPEGKARVWQLSVLKEMIGQLTLSADSKSSISKALESASWPSTSVGLRELLSPNGYIVQLDPVRAPLKSRFLDKWSSDISVMTKLDPPLVGGLEKACGQIFREIEDALEASRSQDGAKYYRALKRWASSFTLRMGAFREGITRFQESLDIFIEVLGIMNKDKRDGADYKKIDVLDDQLKDALNTEVSGSFIQVTTNFEVKSDEITSSLKPRIDGTRDSIMLSLKFGEKTIPLSGGLFVWMMKASQEKMMQESMPDAAMSKIIDARDRAAASAKYYEVDQRLELRTRDRVTKEEKTLTRRGDTLIDD